jgi:hypothetical protein
MLGMRNLSLDLVAHLVEDGIAIEQHANDTFFLLEEGLKML